jgi:hypothetical protein
MSNTIYANNTAIQGAYGTRVSAPPEQSAAPGPGGHDW